MINSMWLTKHQIFENFTVFFFFLPFLFLFHYFSVWSTIYNIFFTHKTDRDWKTVFLMQEKLLEIVEVAQNRAHVSNFGCKCYRGLACSNENIFLTNFPLFISILNDFDAFQCWFFAISPKLFPVSALSSSYSLLS